jgi:hypothetical protein
MADVTQGEVLDGWAERHDLRPPAVVARDVVRGEAKAIVGLVATVASVSAAFVFKGMTQLLLAWSVIAAAAVIAYLAVRSYRVIAGPGWIAAESLAGTRVVRLDRLTRLRVGVGGPGTTYLRLDDADGGRLALERRSTLPPVRTEVIEAVERGLAHGTIDASPTALEILRR